MRNVEDDSKKMLKKVDSLDEIAPELRVSPNFITLQRIQSMHELSKRSRRTVQTMDESEPSR